MNQTAAATSSSSSSSAAAVADSANAAATTKTAANAVTAVASNANASSAAATATSATATAAAKTTSVKLLIKASNQQFDDQIIESDLLWTVKRLKTHLALVYPNKPPVDEQKLIYSGQLLNDTLLLKDVIRSYKDVYTHNHIFHLVYTPKNTLNAASFAQKSKASSASTIGAIMNANGNSSADGLRQRHAAGAGAANTNQQQQQSQYYQQYQQHQHNYVQPQINALAGQCPPYDPANPLYALPFGAPGQLNVQAMATQQAAMYNWIQQVYSQYMEQCIRMSNNAAGVANISTSHAAMPPLDAGSLPINPFLQQLPCVVPPLAGSTGVAAVGATNPVIPFPSATATLLTQPQTAHVSAAQAQVQPVSSTGSTPPTPTVADERAQEQNQQQLEQERQQVAAPRFPNIVQEEQENRDWLDSFFSITRLAIFLTILYFNSSPLRCLAVVIIAGGIYLYHIGVLRLRHERNNNNINRNNNEADQIRRGVRQVQQAAQAAEQQQQENAETAEPAGEVATAAANNTAAEGAAVPAAAAAATADGTENVNTDNNSTSVISVVRTFVVTFFTSLLPETPTL